MVSDYSSIFVHTHTPLKQPSLIPSMVKDG